MICNKNNKDFEVHRAHLRDAFLHQTGFGGVGLSWLAQDASTRHYARLHHRGQSLLLMDAPPIESAICTPAMDASQRQKAGWNAVTRLAAGRVDAFVTIAAYLRTIGLAAPDIIAHDSDNGFALVEDFGPDREIATLIRQGHADPHHLYGEASRTLAHLHARPIPDVLRHGDACWPILSFDALALRASADLFIEWLPEYDRRARLNDRDRARWERARDILIEQAGTFPRAFTLRDYHAENLLYLPDERIGLLDFQDAISGWDAWDMAMLVQDARCAITPSVTKTAIRAYLDATGKQETAFMERLAVIGTLNALRITGLFARLIRRDDKQRYRLFIPRQTELLAHNMRHPAIGEMAAILRETLPFIFTVTP